MAKQKVKNARSAPSGADEASAGDALAEAAPGIKGGGKKLRGVAPKVAGRPKHPGKAKKTGRKPDPGTTRPDDALPLPRAGAPIRKKLLSRLALPRRPARLPPMERLEAAVGEVRLGARASPRTRKLQAAGVPKMAQKLIEEAAEVAIEAVQGNKGPLVNETVDLLYNLVVLLAAADVPLDSVWQEMERREVTLGMAEKLPKLSDPDV